MPTWYSHSRKCGKARKSATVAIPGTLASIKLHRMTVFLATIEFLIRQLDYRMVWIRKNKLDINGC